MPMMPVKFAIATALFVAATYQPAAAEPATAASRPAYGCLKVTAPSIAIKEKSVGTNTTLATASKGEILIKRHRFCTLGSCAVTTRNEVKGFVEKAATTVASCPAKLSKK
jgi:hypothetical protein